MTVSTSETTFYASATCRVSLRVLAPGQALETPPSGQHGLWMPIGQGLQESQSDLKPGTCLYWQDTAGKTLSNTGHKTLEVLELVWQAIPETEQKPLATITESRPWGSFTVLADKPHLKLKQLWVKPGHRLSLQRHQKREEHWFITAGNPVITLNDQTLIPTVGDYIHIPLQAWHRLANQATDNQQGVEIIELQLGSYFGEDDIERQSDDYGR